MVLGVVRSLVRACGWVRGRAEGPDEREYYMRRGRGNRLVSKRRPWLRVLKGAVRAERTHQANVPRGHTPRLATSVISLPLCVVPMWRGLQLLVL